jgi:hypothetical protein
VSQNPLGLHEIELRRRVHPDGKALSGRMKTEPAGIETDFTKIRVIGRFSPIRDLNTGP